MKKHQLQRDSAHAAVGATQYLFGHVVLKQRAATTGRLRMKLAQLTVRHLQHSAGGASTSGQQSIAQLTLSNLSTAPLQQEPEEMMGKRKVLRSMKRFGYKSGKNASAVQRLDGSDDDVVVDDDDAESSNVDDSDSDNPQVSELRVINECVF